MVAKSFDDKDDEPENEIVAYCLIRSVDEGTAYTYFAPTMDDCIEHGKALDYVKNEVKLWYLTETALNKFLARTLELREFIKLSNEEKCKLANTNLLLLYMFSDYDPGEWEVAGNLYTPGFFGFKMKGRPIENSRNMWTDRER